MRLAPKRLKVQAGGYAMIRGPFFEGRRYDKTILNLYGAKAVGMSLLPEACVISLYPDTRVLCLSLVTDAVSEATTHETNQARARKSAKLLGLYLRRIIANLD